MGQISLPRLNRLNVSMTWESELKVNSYHWLSLKLIFFLKYYTQNLFKVEQYNFFNLWKPKLLRTMISQYTITNFTKKFFPTSVYSIATIFSSRKFFHVLDLYLIRFFHLSYIYLIYNNYTPVLNLNKKKSIFLHKYSLFLKTNFNFYLNY